MNAAPHLSGFASHVPVNRVTNQDLEAKIDTSDEWIVSRTGIKSRHVLANDQNASDLGLAAAREALRKSGVASHAVTHVLVTTCTPDYLCPSQACLISHLLGLTKVMAFDINAACAGFVYGVDVARGLLLTHPEAVVLLISTEALTRRINWKDRGTCVLFGDGAAACVLSAASVFPASAEGAPLRQGQCRLVDIMCLAEGVAPANLHIGGGTRMHCETGDLVDESFFLSMHGREVFKYAVRSMTQVSKDLLERNALSVDDVDLFIPHQANLRIIEAVGQRLNLTGKRVFVNVHDYGNTSAASIPIAITEALENGRIKPGMRVLLASFGGTFTWGAALLQF